MVEISTDSMKRVAPPQLGGRRSSREPGLDRQQLLLQLREPDWMREVASADDRDALLARPIGEMLEITVLARGA
jgi:hypothetical protein